MAIHEKPVRQSVSLPPGTEAREKERQHFFELADRLARTRDPEEQSRLKEELARMTFGE